MKRFIASLLLVVMTASAAADPHKILVLQTEGRADAGTRAKIDASLSKLAAADGSQVSPGEITFTDAAAAVGCKPEVPACRDEVLGMLAVDEVVYATTTLKPGGTEIEVHRVTRGGVMRDAKMMLGAGQSADSLDALAPLFTGARPSDPVTTPAPPVDPPGTTALPPPTDPQPPVVTTAPAAYPMQVDAGPSPMRSRLQLAGIIGGGTLMTIGFLLWGEAGTVQEEIDEHPTATEAQLRDLQTLEDRGDSYAAWGNVLFLGGAALGGVCLYYFIKGRKARAAATTARIAPAAFDHGAGITLTFGGSR